MCVKLNSLQTDHCECQRRVPAGMTPEGQLVCGLDKCDGQSTGWGVKLDVSGWCLNTNGG